MSCYNLGSLSVREGFHAWLFLYLVKMAFEYTLHVVVVGLVGVVFYLMVKGAKARDKGGA